jgi:hypothetical protein
MTRAALLVAALAVAGCAPDPCSTDRRNVYLATIDATTRDIVEPTVTVDGATPADLVCSFSRSDVETLCAQVSFTLIGTADVKVASFGYLPQTVTIDGGSLAECGRMVPGMDVDTTIQLTPEVSK